MTPQTTSVSKCTRLYTVLPKLDYCCAVWDPHQVTYRSQLENIQKFAGRIITKNWSSEYPSLCVSLNLKSLSAQKQIQKLKLCYKILTNNSCLPSDHFTPHPCLDHVRSLLMVMPRYFTSEQGVRVWLFREIECVVVFLEREMISSCVFFGDLG